MDCNVSKEENKDGGCPWAFASWEKMKATDYGGSFLVDGVLMDGEQCIIGGESKVLKTTIALDLAISLATATPFLGRFAVPNKKNVMIFSAESGGSTIQANCITIAKARRLDDDAIAGSIQFCLEAVPQFDDVEQMEQLGASLERLDTDVLIVDPTYLAMDGDGQESVFKMGRQLSAVSSVCKRHGVTLIIIHHFKNNPTGQPLRDFAYAGFRQWARQWIGLYRIGDYREGSGLHHLRMTFGGSAKHQGEYVLDIDEGTKDHGQWKVDVLTPDEDQRGKEKRAKGRGDRQAVVEEQVLAVLQGEGLMPAKRINAALKLKFGSGRNPDILGMVLHKMEMAGRIDGEDKQRGSKVDRVYSLRDYTTEATAA